MSWFNSLASWLGTRPARPTNPRLRVEELEDRAVPATADDFGFDSMSASGTRRVLPIVIGYTDQSAVDDPKAHFNQLLFGPGYPNLRDYYLEQQPANPDPFTWTPAVADNGQVGTAGY